MTGKPRFPVPVGPLGRVAVGNALLEQDGERRLTIYVKACFKLAQGAPMTPTAPEPMALDGPQVACQPVGTGLAVAGTGGTDDGQQQVQLLSASEESLLEVTLPVDSGRQADDQATTGLRIERLALDEWLVLGGMAPDGASMRSQLPGVTCLARLWATREPVDLSPALCTIRVDRDRSRCALIWCAEVSVDTTGDPGDWLLAATLAVPNMAFPWPARAEIEVGVPVGSSLDGTVVLGKTSGPGEPPPSTPEALDGTMALTTAELAQAGSSDALPFCDGAGDGAAPGSRPGPSEPIPGAPWTDKAALPPPPISDSRDQTMAVASPSDELRSAQEEAGRHQRAAEQTAEVERQWLSKVDEERKAAEAAEKAAAEEAAKRRAQAEEAFRQEQAEAERAEAERAAREVERRKAAGKKIRTAIYGIFKKPS